MRLSDLFGGNYVTKGIFTEIKWNGGHQGKNFLYSLITIVYLSWVWGKCGFGEEEEMLSVLFKILLVPVKYRNIKYKISPAYIEPRNF